VNIASNQYFLANELYEKNLSKEAVKKLDFIIDEQTISCLSSAYAMKGKI
jgi:hypothetical protein